MARAGGRRPSEAGDGLTRPRRRAARWSLALLALLPRAADAAGPGVSDESLRRAESAIAATMASNAVAGLSVAVVEADRLVWSQGFGFADLENRVPFRASTVYRLASVSKTLTAVAAMQLVERGALDLDAPIQTPCPAFPAKSQPITTRQLLGHLSGIRHYQEGENFDSVHHYATVPESLAAFSADPLRQDPGIAFTYSTYGYVVLGCVVEGASGVPFAEYVRENVARPAGMDHTRTDDVFEIVPDRARGYAKAPDGTLRNADLADTSNKVPGGGMVSTAEDLARFAIALDTHRILKAATFREMQIPMTLRDGTPSPYYGWTIGELCGATSLRHSGSQQGTSAYLLLVPSRGFAIALLANTEGAGLRDLCDRLADIFLGDAS